MPGALLSLLTITAVVSWSDAVQYCVNSDFTLFNGNCYAFHSGLSNTWQGSRDLCQSQSTDRISVDLVSILDEAEGKFINDRVSSGSYVDYWIGFKKLNGAPKDDFTWSDGSTGDYTNWAAGEPNNDQSREDCVELKKNVVWKWNDIDCGTNYKGCICKSRAYDGWETIGDKEYYINAGAADASLNWHRAREWCNDNGADLASITSDAERDGIYNLMQLMGFRNMVWLGLNRLADRRDTWTWSDSTNLADYTKWKIGYPREDTHYRHLCGEMESYDAEGLWYNTNCDSLDHGFVCKRQQGSTIPITTPLPGVTGGHCPSGYFEGGNNKCFRVVIPGGDGYTWREAIDHCRRKVAFLPDIATIADPLEQAVISSMMQDTRTALWTGLYRTGDGNAEWMWVDNMPNRYTNWAAGEPLNPNAHCSELRAFLPPLGAWNSRDCDDRIGVVCQTVKDPSNWISTPPATTPNVCTNGYLPFWGSCYKMVSDAVNWNGANSACKADGAQLTSIHSGPENAFIQSISYQANTPIWIGLHDEERKGEYLWTDHWALTYTRWADSEPSQDPQNGGCVRQRPFDGTWEDYHCISLMGYVCKKTTAPPITTPPPRPGSCPGNKEWQEFGGHCYKFHRLGSETWGAANIKCKADSVFANLASIHSVAENNWVFKELKGSVALSNNVWLGLYRGPNGDFIWLDGSSVDYSLWAAGEPDGQVTGENCVSYNKDFPGHWMDQPCTDPQGFICKAPKVELPSIPPTVPGDCPGDEWVSAGEKCYLFKPNLHMEWLYARQLCRTSPGTAGNADLVTVKDQQTMAFLSAEMFARQDVIGVHPNFWIGLTKQKAGAPYIWVDGGTIEEYDNWAPGEPDGRNQGVDNCGAQGFDLGRWDDTDCYNSKGFVCEIYKGAVPPPTGGDPGNGGGSGGLSGGAIAGIVIGVLAGVALLSALVFFLVTNNINPATKVKDMVSGFSNPFYSSSEDARPVTENEGGTMA